MSIQPQPFYFFLGFYLESCNNLCHAIRFLSAVSRRDHECRAGEGALSLVNGGRRGSSSGRLAAAHPGGRIRPCSLGLKQLEITDQKYGTVKSLNSNPKERVLSSRIAPCPARCWWAGLAACPLPSPSLPSTCCRSPRLSTARAGGRLQEGVEKIFRKKNLIAKCCTFSTSGGQSTDRSLGCAGQGSPWVQQAPSCPRPAAPTRALLPARLRAPSQHCQLCQARAAPADVQARCCRRLLPLSSPCQKESIARPHVQMVRVDFPSAQPDAFTFGVLSRVTAPRGQEEQ